MDNSNRYLLKWLNMVLKPRDIVVYDVKTDFKDGFVLAAFLEELTGYHVYGKMSKLKNELMCLNNITIALKLAYNLCKYSNVEARNFYTGTELDEKYIYAFLFDLALHQSVIGIQGEVEYLYDEQNYEHAAKKAERDALLYWCNLIIAPFGLHADDFTKSWVDGLAYAAILASYDNTIADIAQLKEQVAQLEHAYRAEKLAYQKAQMTKNLYHFEEVLEVQYLLDADFVEFPSDKANIMYLGYVFRQYTKMKQAQREYNLIKSKTELKKVIQRCMHLDRLAARALSESEECHKAYSDALYRAEALNAQSYLKISDVDSLSKYAEACAYQAGRCFESANRLYAFERAYGAKQLAHDYALTKVQIDYKMEQLDGLLNKCYEKTLYYAALEQRQQQLTEYIQYLLDSHEKHVSEQKKREIEALQQLQQDLSIEELYQLANSFQQNTRAFLASQCREHAMNAAMCKHAVVYYNQAGEFREYTPDTTVLYAVYSKLAQNQQYKQHTENLVQAAACIEQQLQKGESIAAQILLGDSTNMDETIAALKSFDIDACAWQVAQFAVNYPESELLYQFKNRNYELQQRFADLNGRAARLTHAKVFTERLAEYIRDSFEILKEQIQSTAYARDSFNDKLRSVTAADDLTSFYEEADTLRKRFIQIQSQRAQTSLLGSLLYGLDCDIASPGVIDQYSLASEAGLELGQLDMHVAYLMAYKAAWDALLAYLALLREQERNLADASADAELELDYKYCRVEQLRDSRRIAYERILLLKDRTYNYLKREALILAQLRKMKAEIPLFADAQDPGELESVSIAADYRCEFLSRTADYITTELVQRCRSSCLELKATYLVYFVKDRLREHREVMYRASVIPSDADEIALGACIDELEHSYAELRIHELSAYLAEYAIDSVEFEFDRLELDNTQILDTLRAKETDLAQATALADVQKGILDQMNILRYAIAYYTDKRYIARNIAEFRVLNDEYAAIGACSQNIQESVYEAYPAIANRENVYTAELEALILLELALMFYMTDPEQKLTREEVKEKVLKSGLEYCADSICAQNKDSYTLADLKEAVTCKRNAKAEILNIFKAMMKEGQTELHYDDLEAAKLNVEELQWLKQNTEIQNDIVEYAHFVERFE